MIPPVIGIVGYKGSGKSSVWGVILSAYRHVVRIRFADPLKEMLACVGLNHDQLDGTQKELSCDLLCGQTPRHAMQTLGTEWGRRLIGQDVWVRFWERSTRNALAYGYTVVADDCRFANEVQAVRALGGEVWEVVRPRLVRADTHASEATIEGFVPDWVCRNDGTLADLKQKVLSRLEGKA